MTCPTPELTWRLFMQGALTRRFVAGDHDIAHDQIVHFGIEGETNLGVLDHSSDSGVGNG